VENTLWFLLAYGVGTAFGYFFGFTAKATKIATITIESLMADGYLKYRELPNGDYDIVKLNEEKDESQG